jgi:chromosome segregation ATPase
LEEAIANEEIVKQIAIERDQLLLQVEELGREIKQQTAERERDRNTIQALRAQITQLEQEISRLEQERARKKEIAASNPPPRDLTTRPFNMDDMRFAKIATIKLDPLPDPTTLIEATERHYHYRNGGYDPSPITLNSIAEYLRHRYSNYDDLCRELGSYNEKARNVLKCRVNTTIWTALSSLDIQLED